MNEFYHVYNRGINRQQIFYSDEEYQDYLDLIRKYLPRCAVRLHAYTLMPNHVHMVLEQMEPYAIASLMQPVTGLYARTFNGRHDRTGHAFQGRHKRKPIKQPGQLIHLCRYLDLNPVQARLVELPENWKYSSCHAYLNGGEAEFLTTELILSLSGGKERYLEYLREPRPRYGEELEKCLIDWCPL